MPNAEIVVENRPSTALNAYKTKTDLKKVSGEDSSETLHLSFDRISKSSINKSGNKRSSFKRPSSEQRVSSKGRKS